MTSEITIRRIAPKDRQAVRHICCATADRGQPLASFYSDCEFVADLMTRYYTDVAPAFSWVAESDGQVIGYLLAAPDSEAARRTVAWRIGPRAVLRALARGALWRAETWRMLAATRQNRRGFEARRRIRLEEYPAELHVNIMDGFRGRHVGVRLMRACLSQLASAGVAGVHANVRSDNPGGRAFFERMGFRAIGEYVTTFPAKGGTQQVEVSVYARTMDASIRP
jgi:ribosomal protein S18 acetylase RimI-like enzyme